MTDPVVRILDQMAAYGATRFYAKQLANPRQMTPYTYADSPIVQPDDEGIDAGPVPGATLPEARVGDGFLSDLIGHGFTLVTFDPALEGLAASDLAVVVLQPDTEAAEALCAGPKAAYLVRPDCHIAARWNVVSPQAVRAALHRSIEGGQP